MRVEVGNLSRLARDPRRMLMGVRGNLELWANLVILTWAVVFAVWQGMGFAISIATVFAIWAILAVSLNLVVGYTGLLSIGHIGFFGIGAYSVAVLTSTTDYSQLRTEEIPTFGWSFFAALPVGVGIAGLTALVVGVVFNRFRDDIFVLVSFGFAIIAYNSFLNLRSVTRGAFGIHEVARPQIGSWVFDKEGEFLALALVCPGAGVTGLVGHRVIVLRARANHHSRGRAGNRGVRLPRYALQAGDLGHFRHDGSACRWAIR